jgi:hypothetical protein
MAAEKATPFRTKYAEFRICIRREFHDIVVSHKSFAWCLLVQLCLRPKTDIVKNTFCETRYNGLCYKSSEFWKSSLYKYYVWRTKLSKVVKKTRCFPKRRTIYTESGASNYRTEPQLLQWKPQTPQTGAESPVSSENMELIYTLCCYNGSLVFC